MDKDEKTMKAAGIDFTICIPSYHRANRQKTLDLLEQFRIPKEKIFVFVQTKEDDEAYKAAGIGEKAGEIIFRSAENVAQNRNNILDYFGRGQKIVMMDDDVFQICRLAINGQTGKRKIVSVASGEEFLRICKIGFGLAKLNGTVAWALNIFNNPLYMSKGYRTWKNINFQVGGVVNSDMRFDPEFALYEDSDFCARVLKRYGAVISLDEYSAKFDRDALGGCHEKWEQNEEREKYAELFRKKHGDIYDVNTERKNALRLKRRKQRA